MASAEEPVPSIDMAESIRTTPRALTPILETEPGPEDSTTAFHPDADLKVIIRAPNNDPTIYMVCASALTCASPVWRSMLYCDAANAREMKDETRYDQTQSMVLRGDSEAVALLFRIIHYDFRHVPKEPTLNQLFELSKSACQYRCTHILYPWAQQWVSQLATFFADVNCYSECHKALYVAWTFGETKLYRDMVDALIVSAKIDLNGKIVNVSGQPLEDMLMPSDLLKTITTTRASTIAKILDAVKSPIHVLSTGTQGNSNAYCKVGKDSHECEIMMLGSAIPTLAKAGLFPVPEHEKFTDSIVNLKDKLEGVKTIPYIGREWMPHMSHENCELGFCKSVMTCLEEMMVPLSASIMSWMSDQAETCGIEATAELQEWRRISNEPSIKHVEDHGLVSGLEKEADNNDENVVGSAQEENSEGES
ncbi:hypothetical protein GGS24DRAFT_467619 [Hypoxylon argillaceum]|nr:hypothetical protein GGS24DRAFT_467619 [Hypoxylon argillaceum]KAI1155618.1 hypothetical protein F4825DRAFT_447313 [Nemania diffusa]